MPPYRLARQRGAALAIGLLLLLLVSFLALAGAETAHLEHLLAQNEQFRENASAAASAGLEAAISSLNSMPATATPIDARDFMPGSAMDRWQTTTRFMGYETSLSQADGTHLAGAHFEIVSEGFSARRAVDKQRQGLMLVVAAPASLEITPRACEPASGTRCWREGDQRRTFWLRE